MSSSSFLVDETDDQRIHGWMRVWEVGSGHRPGGDEHMLADATPEDVEDHEPSSAVVDLHLEEGSVGKPLDPLGRPHAADHLRLEHQCSFSISTPRVRALSRASG